MRPRLLHPFAEQKSIKAMPPFEEDYVMADGQSETFGYKIFPILKEEYYPEIRPIPDFNQDALFERTFGSPIIN